MQVAYDPCVCMGKSYFAISYKGIKEWSITLDTREQGKYIKDINDNLTKLIQKDPCENAPELIIGGIVAGAGVAATNGATAISAVGPLAGFVKGALCLVGADPSTIKKAELFAKFASASADLISSGTKWGLYNKIENSDKFYLASDPLKIVTKKELAELVTKSTKALSTGASMLEYLSKPSELSKLDQPTVGTLAKSTLDVTYGKASDTALADTDILLAVPGSQWQVPNNLLEFQSTNANSKTLPGYPLYNEALGTLAFIETPQVTLYKNPDDYNYFKPKIFAAYINKDLKYSFNPLCKFDMSKTTIGMALEYVFKGIDGKTTKSYMSELVDKDEIREVIHIHQLLRDFDINISNGRLFQINLKVFIDYETLPYKIGAKTRRGIQIFTVPCNVAEEKYVEFIHLYPTDLAGLDYQLNELKNILPSWFKEHTILSIGQNNNIIISPLTFSQNHVIYSDDEIFINADLSTTNGATLIIRSAKAIHVNSNVKIGDNVILEIGNNYYGSWYPQTHLSLSQVSKFCNEKTLDGVVYNADEFDAERNANPTPNPIVKNKNISTTHSLQIFPNPASSIFNIQLSEADVASVTTVNIYDITGHLLMQHSKYMPSISTQEFANGTYIIEVILNDNTKMHQRLVVTH